MIETIINGLGAIVSLGSAGFSAYVYYRLRNQPTPKE